MNKEEHNSMTQEMKTSEIGKTPTLMRSNSGTSNVEINGLQGKDICAIIKACAAASVTELKVGDLEVKFGTTAAKEPEGTTAPYEGTHSLPPQLGTTEEDAQETEEQTFDLLQQRAIEDLAHMQNIIDDPLAFEDDMVDSFVHQRIDKQQGGLNDTQESRRSREIL